MNQPPNDGPGRRSSAPSGASAGGSQRAGRQGQPRPNGRRGGRGGKNGGARRRRFRFVASAGAMSLLIGIVIARLLFVQGLNASTYLADARSEYVHEISFLGERGAILDRNGDELAMSVPMTTVYADPYQVTNPGREAQALANALGVPEATLQADLSEASGFVYLARTIPDATAAKVEKLLNARQPARHLHDAGTEAVLPRGSAGVAPFGNGGDRRAGPVRARVQVQRPAWRANPASSWRTWTRPAVRSPGASRSTRPRSEATTSSFRSTNRLQYDAEEGWREPLWPLRPTAGWR